MLPLLLLLFLLPSFSGAAAAMSIAELAREGAALFGAGRVAEAAERYRALIALVPTEPFGWTNLGVCHERAGDVTGAQTVYAQCAAALAGTPGAVACLNNACNLAVLQTSSSAKVDLSPCVAALRAAPEDTTALRNMGNAHVQLAEYTAAIPLLKRAHEQAPGERQTFHNLCLAYSRAGRCKKALSCSEALVNAFPGDADALSGLAIAANCCNRTDPRGIGSRMKAAELAARIAVSAGCESGFTLQTSWIIRGDDGMASERVVSQGNGEVYGMERATPLPLGKEQEKGYKAPWIAFEEKDVSVVELHDVFFAGPSGLVLRGAPHCVVHTGDHTFASKVPEEVGAAVSSIGDGKDVVVFESPVAAAVQQNPGNYYHAIAETAGRVLVLRDHLLRNRPMPLLVPSSRSSLVSQALGLIFPPDSKQEVIDYTGQQAMFFRTLFVVDWRHRSGIAMNSDDSWLPFFPPRSVLRLVSRELSSLALGASVPDAIPEDWKVVYASRKDARVRRVLPNEDKIIAGLRGLVGEDRFTVVAGRGLSLVDQIRAFGRAAVVVGPHGAGFTNMLWAPKNAAIVLFPMRPVSDVCFAHMSGALGHEYFEVASLHSYYYGDYQLTNETAADVVDSVRQVLVLRNLLPVAIEESRHSIHSEL